MPNQQELIKFNEQRKQGWKAGRDVGMVLGIVLGVFLALFLEHLWKYPL